MEQQNEKTATLDGVILAQSAATEEVEGNHYFPASSVNWDGFTETDLTTGCHWKGTANYYTVKIGDKSYENVAWTYRSPKDGASQIKDYVAFYPSVTVS